MLCSAEQDAFPMWRRQTNECETICDSMPDFIQTFKLASRDPNRAYTADYTLRSGTRQQIRRSVWPGIM